jgi:hypothetical protein
MKMTLDNFKKVLDDIRKRDALLEKLNDLGFDFTFDNPFMDSVIDAEEIFFETIYTKEGVDWIYWYLYEQPEFLKRVKEDGDKPEYHAWDAEGNPMDLSTDEKLWEMLEKDYGDNA